MNDPHPGDSIINQGFTFRGKYPDGSPKSHICIVLSVHEENEQKVCYVIMTSQGKKARTALKNDKAALVLLDPSEYKHYFEKPEDETCIKCDKTNVKTVSLTKLEHDLKYNIIYEVERVKLTVLIQVKMAVRNSKTFTNEEIIYVLGE